MELLFLAILSLTLFAYQYHKGDFMSPAFILFLVFSFSSFMGILGNQEWGVNIRLATIAVVLMGLISFFVGEVFVDQLGANMGVRIYKMDYSKKYYKVKWLYILIFLVVGLVVFYFYYKKINEIASLYGYRGEMSFSSLSYAKLGLGEGAQIGTVLTIAVNIVYAVGYCCIYMFCYNVTICNMLKRKNFYLLLPIIPQLLCNSISGSRNGFITVFVVFFFCYNLMYYKVNGFSFRAKDLSKLFKILIIVLPLFYLVFQLLGIFLGKTSVRTPLEMLYLYTGSPMPALGKYMNTGVQNSEFIGQETFVGIANWIHRIFGTPAGVKIFEHVRFANDSTSNIFTCFRGYLDDFGYFGYFLVPMVCGFAYKFYYLKIKTTRKIGIGILIYSYFIYYLVSDVFACSTTIYFLSSAQLSQFLWIFIMYYLFKKLCYRCA